MACDGMASSSSFPSNFIVPMQTHCGEENQLGIPVGPLFLASLQDLRGVPPMMGKISRSFPGIETGDEMTADDDLSDDGSPAGEKKKRLNIEQVRTLERNFELGNRLEPERKMQLARVLGLRPRQVAIWFQNRRARWKTKQLEKEYDVLKRQLEATKTENEALQVQNKKLQSEILALRVGEASELINLNKETEGSCSNRSENSSDINLDISRTSATESPPPSSPNLALLPISQAS